MKKLAFTAAFLAPVVGAFATDPDVTGIATGAGTLLSAIYPIVIGGVGFSVLIALVKMVKKGK